MKRQIILAFVLILTVGIICGRAYLRHKDGKLDGLTDRVDAFVAQGKFPEADRLLDQAESRFGSHPVYWLLRAKVECGRERPGACLDAYVKALPGGGVPEPAAGKAHLEQLLEVDGRPTDVTQLVRTMGPDDATDVLERGLKHAEHDHRWNAVAQLEAIDRRNVIDYVDLYVRDLSDKVGCEDRREAVERLAEFGADDALEPLRLVRAETQGSARSACLGDRVDQAIRKLESR